jgi:hypothetical protein
MEDVMLWVGQFGIAAGEAREETPWVGVFPEDPAGPLAGAQDGESSDLFLIVEPATAGSAEFCEELKEAVGTVFHRSKASLTGGLLRALQAAHENLREWNRQSLKDHRVAAGISCVAVRGHEAYLAQVAPAAAAHLRAGRLQELIPSLPDATEPLGLFDEFWPQFARFDLDPGDRLLLLSPGLARALPPDELAASLALPAEETIPSLYRLARALPDCGAVLVAAVSPPQLPGAEEIGARS